MEKGAFQQHFKVYGKKGEKCSNIDCKEIIIKTVISNRSSFFVIIVKNNKVDPINTPIYIIFKMPNTKSAIRRVRRLKNKPKLTELEKVNTRMLSNKWTTNKIKTKRKIKKYFPKFQSILMQVAKTGIINKKTASRKISRVSKRI